MIFFLLVKFVMWLWGIHELDSLTVDIFAVISFFEIIFIGGYALNFYNEQQKEQGEEI